MGYFGGTGDRRKSLNSLELVNGIEPLTYASRTKLVSDTSRIDADHLIKVSASPTSNIDF
jgi:hypothetical protein